ncbi:glycosyltransferase [Martelella alba]|nr:glycosyltransferase [Martelella alba]
MGNKLVSVYIPTHNRSKLLERALLSVLNQDYEYLEILICDDGSSDNTHSLVENYKKKYQNIIYLKNDQPKGACAARNLGIFAAKGIYITGLDDDDEFVNNRISTFVDFFEKNTYEFICSGITFKNGNHSKSGYDQEKVILLDDLLYENIVGSQVFTKRENLVSIGGFDESFKAWQDYDAWLRLCVKCGNGYNIGRATYIQHLEHEFGRITTSNKLDIGYRQFIEKHNSLLKRQHKENLYLNYKMAKSEPITLTDLISNLNKKNFLNICKYKARKILKMS